MIAGRPGATAMFSGAWRGPCPNELRRALAAEGYLLEPCDRPLPHPSSGLVSADFAPPAHNAAAPIGSVRVIGIAGLPGFPAAGLAHQWSLNGNAEFSGATVSLAETPPAGWSPISLAAHLERDFTGLVRQLDRAGADRFILPPVLGTSHDSQVRLRLQEAIGGPVGEALGVPPSLPGWRLHHALQQVIAHTGVAVLAGRAVSAHKSVRRINSIRLDSGDVVTARAFVLASGKYAAGGIEANGDFREPVFDCPVWVEHLGEFFGSNDPLMLSDPEYEEDQPILRAGVHTDDTHRPIDRVGEAVFENVFVAGTIRAGWTSANRGIGDAAEDGWYAGMTAMST